MYKSGIKAWPNIRFRLVSYAPNNKIGKAAINNATGLNQPGITFLSSIYPMRKAITVVNNIARIFSLYVKK